MNEELYHNENYRPAVRPSRNRDVVFAVLTLVSTMVMANSIIEGGMNLGYAVSLLGLMAVNILYLGRKLKWNPYGLFNLAAAVLLAAGHGWSSDGTMKFFAYLGMVAAWYQTLVLLRSAGKRNPGTIGVAGDMLYISWGLPMKELEINLRGLGWRAEGDQIRRRRTGGVLAGVGCAVPVLAVVLPLLMESDAAFEGLMDLTIFADVQTLFLTVLVGVVLFAPLYSRGVSLNWYQKPEAGETKYRGSVQALTVNSFLGVLSFFYVMYLMSQLAYFFSGFAGILPEGYTASDYARRGFFEMCGVCAINFAIIALTAGLVTRTDKGIPWVTRALCLFVCAFSLVLVATSASKMGLYIGVYGLTRLRLLTSVFMLGLDVAVAALAVWLLAPKFPYMKVILSTALILGTLTLWADVDTQVAKYNVESYRSGKLATVDMDTLAHLGSGSTEYVALLLEDGSAEVAERAGEILASRCRRYYSSYRDENGVMRMEERTEDLRAWNAMDAREKEILTGLLTRLRPYMD